jgi:hypothetical protein
MIFNFWPWDFVDFYCLRVEQGVLAERRGKTVVPCCIVKTFDCGCN